MLKTKLVLIATVIVSLASTSVFANKINLPRGEKEGTFYCTVNALNLLKTVDIDTDKAEVKGFCMGEAYVAQKGHIKSMPINTLRSVYFEYKKTPGKSASINIISPAPDDVTCTLGKGEGRKPYSDADYC